MRDTNTHATEAAGFRASRFFFLTTLARFVILGMVKHDLMKLVDSDN